MSGGRTDTVKSYIRTLYRKIGVRTRLQPRTTGRRGHRARVTGPTAADYRAGCSRVTGKDKAISGWGQPAGRRLLRTHGRVAGFRDMSSMVLTHRYAKSGRYTVTVTGCYCGLPGHTSTTRHYQITIH